jgi:hypothetical protein
MANQDLKNRIQQFMFEKRTLIGQLVVLEKKINTTKKELEQNCHPHKWKIGRKNCFHRTTFICNGCDKMKS